MAIPSPTAATPAEQVCEHCGGTGWRVIPDGGAGRAARCDCQIHRRGENFLETSGIPERYRGCRIAKFDTNSLDSRVGELLLRAKTVAQRYVETFLDPKTGGFRRSGLLLIGPPGVGKTHLAAAVLTELIETYRVRGRFVDFTSLLHQIQSTFDNGSSESKRSILDPVIRAEVLVLDELGAQKPTEWVMDNLYLIMNSRYTAGRPTIFTSNYRLEGRDSASGRNGGGRSGDGRSGGGSLASRKGGGGELLVNRISAALVSRLYEMAQPLVLDGPDYRQTVKMHQHRIGG